MPFRREIDDGQTTVPECDADASVTRSYKVSGTPTIIFLDRKGVVRYFANELPEDYGVRLDALLSEKG